MGTMESRDWSQAKRKYLEDDTDEHKQTVNLDTDEESELSSFDDSDEDEEDDEQVGEATEVVEHNENDEPFPKYAAYDKDFSQVRQDLVAIPKAALHMLNEGSCSNRRVQNLKRHADEVANLPQAKREKIALLGRTAAGKSSLINSLLGMPNMAKAMASGEACTYVSTEYECPFTAQAKKFAAKVEYFDNAAIRELLSRLLRHYYSWNFEQQDDWTDDEKQEYVRLSKTAFITFRALFCDQNGFDSSRAATEFLHRAYVGWEHEALDVFVGWCEEHLEEKEADEADHTEYLDADTEEELHEQLDPLVFSNSRFDTPTLWPLVKKVRIGIDGPRILRYMILVDLPGLDDTNQVRVNASLEIMRSCDSIWVVTKIDRAITESGVDGLLSRYGKSYKMAVVCTGIDEHIEDTLAAHLQDEGQSIGNHYDLLDEERALRRMVRSLPKKAETQRARLEGRNRSRANKKPRPLTEVAKEKLRAKIGQFEAELTEAEANLKRVSQERFELIVDARNAYTIRRLQDEKSDYLATHDSLAVFCVSNMHYAAAKGARIVSGPRLDAEMTGIPALRKYILERAAPAQVQAIEDFMTFRFDVFMKGLAMWAKTYSVEGSEQLLEAVTQPQGSAAALVEDFVTRILDSAEQFITKPLSRVQTELTEVASRALEVKKTWHWGTVRAFIRRDGNHHTSVVPQQSWNEQFLDGANKITRANWQSFLDGEKLHANLLKRKLLALIEGISQVVDNHPASYVLPMDRIKQMMAAQLHGIEQACRTHQEDTLQELRNIKLDTTQDREAGYFTQAMDEAYEKCKSDSGTGVKQRSLATFEAHLTLSGDRSPFAIMCKKLLQAINKDAEAKGRILTRKVEDIMSVIHRQFDDMIDEKIDDPSEDKLRKEFRDFLRKKELAFEEIKADMARIKRRYDD